jgi:hypothetical protein
MTIIDVKFFKIVYKLTMKARLLSLKKIDTYNKCLDLNKENIVNLQYQ